MDGKLPGLVLSTKDDVKREVAEVLAGVEMSAGAAIYLFVRWLERGACPSRRSVPRFQPSTAAIWGSFERGRRMALPSYPALGRRTMTNRPRPYDVWRLPFAYEDDLETVKVRPVVAVSVDDAAAIAIALKATGCGPRRGFSARFASNIGVRPG